MSICAIRYLICLLKIKVFFIFGIIMSIFTTCCIFAPVVLWHLYYVIKYHTSVSSLTAAAVSLLDENSFLLWPSFTAFIILRLNRRRIERKKNSEETEDVSFIYTTLIKSSELSLFMPSTQSCVMCIDNTAVLAKQASLSPLQRSYRKIAGDFYGDLQLSHMLTLHEAYYVVFCVKFTLKQTSK